MSALWTVADLVKATGGVASGEWCGWRIEIDGRKVRAGDIFVALKGENFDGHDFVEQAFSKGAIAAIVSHELQLNCHQLIVADTQKALEDLAKYNRARSSAKVVGITGSVGKTSTKEMLKLALSAHGKTYATTGNYNNHIGTPLNLANLSLDAEFAVFEMGMNHVGEIAHLTKMVQPHIAVITNVEAVHLEFFSGVEEIAEAKSEIFESNPSYAIINADQPFFQNTAQNAAMQQLSFGSNENADCRLLKYTPTDFGCEVEASICSEKISYKLSATGKHFAIASLSVLAVAKALNLPLQETANALLEYKEVEGRGGVCKVGDFYLINDAYNASPASMKASFAKTAEVWQAKCEKGRKIAVLGDMLELGESSPLLHADLAKSLIEHGFDAVYCAGALMKNLYDALPKNMQAGYTQFTHDLLPLLKFQVNDVVLIKGSHGSKMYEIANELLLKNEENKNAV